MADESNNDETEGGDDGGSSKKPLLMLIVAALVALLVGAGGAYFFLAPSGDAAATMEGEAAAGEGAAAAAEPPNTAESYRERLYSLEPFVVNVTGDGYTRYLKVKVELEADRVELKDELEARLPQVRDALIVLFSSKKLGDITDFEGKALLKDDVLLRVNAVLQTGAVKSALFTEFVVQ